MSDINKLIKIIDPNGKVFKKTKKIIESKK